MNEFFGLSMTYIMAGLLVILAFAAAVVGWVLLRNRIMFLVGVRNIPRRRAQTILIIVGLMLSTVIISTAFGIGDTAGYSITNTTYERLGRVDEVVQAQADTSDNGDEIFAGAQSLITALPIDQGDATGYVEQFRALDRVDGAVSVIRGPVAAENASKGQAEPVNMVVGLDQSQIEGFADDIVNLKGDVVRLADLLPGEIYANESAADELDIEPGDDVTLFAHNQPRTFRVRDVVRDRVLTGAIAIQQGFVMTLREAQQLLVRPGQVDLIAVSNDGAVRNSSADSAEITDELNRIVAGTRLRADETKADLVQSAADTASFFVTIFVVLGLFSIAAGMMLIFLIFVMLAAERKVEMGMMRAVGTRRNHLIQSFISEGMVYNVGAAAIGCAIGVGVAIIMIQVMRRIFGGEGLEITFHISARSLVISYSIGVVLTFLTVAFSSWRIGNLNIVSAIRDVPDPVLQKPRPSFRSPLSLVRWFFIKSPRWRAFLRDGLLTAAAGLGIAGGVLLFVLATGVYGAGAAGGVAAVVLGIVGGIVITICAVAVLVLLNNMFQAGPLCLTTGVVLMYVGISVEQAFPFGAGLTLFALGLALTALAFGVPGRPVWTTMGLVLLFFWLLLAGNNLPGASKLNGNVEMFFLSGVTMVLSGTFVLIYNADLMLRGVTLLGGRFSTLVPSIRTAVAYPLANKFRTGMTIAMISLVMFALVMMSTMNENFGRVFLNESARGGFDIIATENPGNPIDDLQQQLRDDGAGDTAAEIAGVDKVEAANRQTSAAAELKAAGVQDKDYDTYPIWGVSEAFTRDTTLKFQGRARGFESDRAVWDALASNPDYAVIDAFSVSGGGGFGDGSALVSSIEQTDRVFDPVPVSVRDLASGRTRTVQVIGVIAVEGSGLFNGLFLGQQGFDEIFENPESSVHYVRVQPGADANGVAHAIERTLLRQGVQADSLKKIIDDFQAQNRSFLYLIQGFMGIGLFVGIAAIGVIAFRTVVERRQQIGMLRAIGYSRRAVALSFIMESTFTAVLGIFSGIALGLLLAYQLVHTDDFIPGGIDSFYIPWVQILFIGGLALVASLLMTIIPSRQASGIPIAEALRYE